MELPIKKNIQSYVRGLELLLVALLKKKKNYYLFYSHHLVFPTYKFCALNDLRGVCRLASKRTSVKADDKDINRVVISIMQYSVWRMQPRVLMIFGAHYLLWWLSSRGADRLSQTGTLLKSSFLSSLETQECFVCFFFTHAHAHYRLSSL